MGNSRSRSEQDIATELRLHPERSPVTRLSRKVIVGLGSFVSIVTLSATIWAFTGRDDRQKAGPELYNTEHKTTADELLRLPRDYAGLPPNVPRLGPPLPGDLGRPILTAQGHDRAGVDPEQQRVAQERDAARTSRLFAPPTTTSRVAAPPALGAPLTGNAVWSSSELPPTDIGSVQNMQERKLAFLNAPVDRRTVSPERLQAPASRYILQAGSVIPAALLTGVRSDLPGQVTSQVTEHVYDSPTGRHLLIPQGSKLIGTYDSQVAYGQSRVLMVWTRLILPNGRSIVLERQAGADPEGYAGLEDQVDHHWGRLFMAAAVSTLLGVGSQIGASNDENMIVTALRRGGSDSLNQTGQQVVRRNLNIQPTLTIRPGLPVRVIINRDLILAPIGGGGDLGTGHIDHDNLFRHLHQFDAG